MDAARLAVHRPLVALARRKSDREDDSGCLEGCRRRVAPRTEQCTLAVGSTASKLSQPGVPMAIAILDQLNEIRDGLSAVPLFGELGRLSGSMTPEKLVDFSLKW